MNYQYSHIQISYIHIQRHIKTDIVQYKYTNKIILYKTIIFYNFGTNNLFKNLNLFDEEEPGGLGLDFRVNSQN